jgi:hypothetical protein
MTQRSKTMQRFRFPIAVAATSLALVLALGVAGVLAAPTVLANAFGFGFGFGGPGHFGPPFGAAGWGGPGFTLPPELQGLAEIPPAERFSHFRGVQVNLTDKDNQPLAITVTPGTISVVDAASLTIAANDGTTKSYTLDNQTIIRGKPARGGAQATQPTLANGDKVVVVTLNNGAAARAVIAVNPDGFGPHGPRGPFGR